MGLFFAYWTYLDDIASDLFTFNFYTIPFFMVSFWLYLFAFFFILYLILDLEIPDFFGSLTFSYCFVYGLGCIMFYSLFMVFVRGFTVYHFFNIFAHGFVGLQSLIFLQSLKKIKINSIYFTGFVFLFKDIIDYFFNGFLYFVKFEFPIFLKLFFAFFIIFLQIASLYLLSKKIRLK